MPTRTVVDGLTAAHIPALDFLRAVAVLLVIFYHFGLSIPGGLGVEIFFVLSGFLITWLMLEEYSSSGGVSLRAFYWRRAARILPAFYAYLAIGAVFTVARGQPLPKGEILSAAAYVVNYYQGLVAPPVSFLSHCWSLAVEEQFYILWPAAFLALIGKARGLTAFLAFSVLAGWAIRVTVYFGLGVDQSYVYRAFETRFDHLAVGCLLAVLLRRKMLTRFWSVSTFSPWLIPVTAGLLVGSSLLQVSFAYRYAVGYSVESVLIAILIVQLITYSSAPGWRLIEHPVVRYVGGLSYSLYLYQQLTVYPARRITEGYPLLVQLCVTLIVTLIVAAVSFHCWERPVRSWLRSWSRSVISPPPCPAAVSES